MKLITNSICLPGFKFSGVKLDNNYKVALIKSDYETTSAALFTTNKLNSQSVIVSKENAKYNNIRAIIVNTGCANCCTGKRGIRDAKEIIQYLSKKLKIQQRQILLASTGIIGEYLNVKEIKRGIDKAIEKLSEEGMNECAQCITTTDKVEKKITIEFELSDFTPVHIGGIAKGAGMIAPNLSTFLCFLMTDIAILSNLLHQALIEAVNQSFNVITVDGEQSPSDTVCILSNGIAKNPVINKKNKDFYIFQEALSFVTKELSKKIIKDAEGATKFIKINVYNGKSRTQVERIAKRIATSMLVKTALFGKSTNWGRIIAAIGDTDVNVNLNKIDISYEDIKVAKNGNVVRFDEQKLKNILNKDELSININLNQGKINFSVYTSDLSYDYVKINAEYKT